MKAQRLLVTTAIAGTFAALGGTAMAQQNTIRIGVANVQPHSSASDVSGPFTPAGLSLDVRNVNTPIFSYLRDLDEHWAVEFCLGVPPTHDVALKVSNPSLPGSAQAFNGQIGAKVRQVAPTAFVNYNFLDKSSKWRPFVGIGVNYTKFDNAEATQAGNALNGGPTSLSLKDSWGLAAQAGVTYQIDEKWSLNAAIATAQVKTKLTTNTLGIVRTADIKFHPQVVSLSVGYTF